MCNELEEMEIIKRIKKTPAYYSTIKTLFSVCKRILDTIPSIFPHYTLHDINHSVRVIGYMNDLIKKNIDAFSDLHLALIVYVGLLHDIGMAITDSDKMLISEQLTKKNKRFRTLSSEEQTEAIKDCIRKNHAKRVEVMLKTKYNETSMVKSLLYSGETLSYDLSELVSLICQSHCEDIDWITNNLSQVEIIGHDVICPQHVAFLLRLGDALDIDDRRAPYVLYQHLKPKGQSQTEWKKHIPVSNYEKIYETDNGMEIIFSGECNDPFIYRELLSYIDRVSNDISAINKINSGFDFPFCFRLNEPITNRIKTKGFKSVSLRFVLQYEQLSSLLMGEKIYGSSKDGLRELVQNAIDAVLVLKDIYEKEYRFSYNPMIEIVLDKEKNQFIIIDNGIGMSDEILKKYFLNIGNSYYKSTEFSEQCSSYKPIGHFGIGFLSCFMLSSNVEIITKHYLTSKTLKVGFEKQSPYITEYDCKNDPLFSHGTKITLNYEEIIPAIFSCEQEIKRYIMGLVITDGFGLRITSNGFSESIDVKRPSGIMKIDSGEIQYSVGFSDNSNVLFNFFDLFEKNENVYIIDERKDSYFDTDDCFYNLAFLEEALDSFEAKLQLKGISFPDEFEFFLTNDCPFLFGEYCIDSYRQSNLYYLVHGSIKGFYLEYFNRFIHDNKLKWLDIPFIEESSIMESFLISVRLNGLDKALSEFKSKVEYISIISVNDRVSTSGILSVINRCLEYRDSTAYLSIYEEIVDKAIQRSITLMKGAGNYYSVIDSDCSINLIEDVRIYLKGIRIDNIDLTIPFSMGGTNVSTLYLNSKSNEFDTDISRHSFDVPTKEKMSYYIGKIIYNCLLLKQNNTKEERELIEEFLDEFYR